MKTVLTALPDALIVAGGCALSYGAGLLLPAAGYIVAGLLLIAGGVASARNVKTAKAEG